MIKYKTRVNYRKKYLNMKGYLIVCITIIIFVSAMFGWAIKGNMELKKDLFICGKIIMDEGITEVIR